MAQSVGEKEWSVKAFFPKDRGKRDLRLEM